MSDEQFIKSVEKGIPNPPFKINIITSSNQKTLDENSFKNILTSTLYDYSWEENENIRTFNIELNQEKKGILGSVTVAILEHEGKPIDNIELNSREVEVEGQTFTLERKIRLSINKIEEISKSITIDDKGDIRKDDSWNYLVQSKSRISLHGIEIPSSLFPETWMQKNNQVTISWPFPLIIIIDICGNRDLDLNSPRTEIIQSNKWFDFEEELAYLICKSISNKVSKTYWNELYKVFLNNTKNESFLRAIKKLEKARNY
jgi:hypothetical protein